MDRHFFGNPLNIEDAFTQVTDRVNNIDTLVRVLLSGRRRNMFPTSIRIEIRPIILKTKLLLQVMENDGIQTITKNFEPNSFDLKQLLGSGYANFLVESINERLNIRITKRGDAMVQREELQLLQNLKHDRTKPRLLEFADPYLIEIGISDAAGNVKPSRQDKFKQVEEFLRLLVPTVSHSISSGHITAPNAQNPLEIVDLGCGHAYLTFAAHQYFSAKQIPVHVLGIDIREESRIRNTQIAEKLGIAGSIEFRAETIARFQATKVDVAIALHACDTATDDAIAWAVKNNAKMILAAPCCHHELQTQMIAPPQSWDLITRYGLLKERLGDILTDSFRAQILRILGYRVEVIEFVAGEHTPRNLMIRAVKTDAVVNAAEIQKLNELMLQWKMVPVLVSRLRDELNAKGCDF